LIFSFINMALPSLRPISI